MRLLKITDSEYDQFEPYFEEVESVDLDQVAPQVRNGQPSVRANGGTTEDYDAVFAEIPIRNHIFGRVLLEMIEEKGTRVNYPSTAFFIMAKKNYLYYVLHQQGIPSPKTVSVATEKAARNMGKELEAPVIARKLVDMEETERQKIDSEDEMDGFAEGSEYQDDILLYQEYTEGDKYRCLVIDGQVISLEETSDSWKFKDSLKYSNISDSQRELVKRTTNALGTPVAEVMLRGKKVFDVNPNPDLQLYTDTAGKNTFEAVADLLKG